MTDVVALEEQRPTGEARICSFVQSKQYAVMPKVRRGVALGMQRMNFEYFDSDLKADQQYSSERQNYSPPVVQMFSGANGRGNILLERRN